MPFFGFFRKPQVNRMGETLLRYNGLRFFPSEGTQYMEIFEWEDRKNAHNQVMKILEKEHLIDLLNESM